MIHPTACGDASFCRDHNYPISHGGARTVYPALLAVLCEGEKRKQLALGRFSTEMHNSNMSSVAGVTPRANVSPKDLSSPSNQAERDEDEAWSGDEDDGDEPPARKRPRTARPISVSCEKCKERKVSSLVRRHGCRSPLHALIAYCRRVSGEM